VSDLLNPTRLYWNGMSGLAKCDEVRVTLKHPPRVPGIPQVFEIDFVPGVIAEIRERSIDEKRALRDEERDACIKHLYRMASAARDVIDRDNTFVTVVLRP
jgi:hypothetical protein